MRVCILFLTIIATYTLYPLTVNAQPDWSPIKSSQEISVARQADETGDVFGSLSWQPDLADFSISYTTDTVLVKIVFYGDVSLNISSMYYVNGYIDLDTDQSSSTGGTSFSETYSPYIFNLGIEYFIEIDEDQAYIYSKAGYLQHATPISLINNRTLQFDFPLSAINGKGKLNAALIVGSYAESTDTIPNGGFITSETLTSAPAMGTWGIFAMAGLLMSGLLLVRRRRT